MKKYLKVIIAALVVLVFIGTFVFLYQKSKPQPVVYDEFTPKVADISKTTVITGAIEPRDEVEVKPQISGIITEIYKEAGQMVKAGEVIAKVKVIPDMGQLSSAESRVRLAEINLKQAKVNFDREKQLYDKQLVSAEEYDNVRQTLDQAREEKTAAIDALEVVRDGTVADMSDLIFKGNIDETEVGQLVTGMPMRITIGALQNLKFDASLEYISPKATDNNGANQFEIKAAVTVPQGNDIRSGYSANAEIELASAKGVLTVPESAIEFSGNETYVYVIKGSGDDKTYERRKVTTGLSDGINIEIKSGLKKNEKVRGPQKVNE